MQRGRQWHVDRVHLRVGQNLLVPAVGSSAAFQAVALEQAQPLGGIAAANGDDYGREGGLGRGALTLEAGEILDVQVWDYSPFGTLGLLTLQLAVCEPDGTDVLCRDASRAQDADANRHGHCRIVYCSFR